MIYTSRLFTHTKQPKSRCHILSMASNTLFEIEYILPHYTVTRVHFGDFTNTIIPSALPLSSNQTKLSIKAYRNNWVYGIPPIDFLFDQLYLYLMKKLY